MFAKYNIMYIKRIIYYDKKKGIFCQKDIYEFYSLNGLDKQFYKY